jgi:hypothetical protein
MTWDSRLDAYKTPEQDQRPTWTGAVSASSTARQEDQQLTELTQLSSGHSSKVMELLVNHNLPSGLQAVFEAAADSEHYQQTLAAFTLQRQQRAEASQQAQEQEEHERSEQAWLQSMSPEYRQAYADLQATVADVHSQYAELRQKLEAQRQQLDANAKELDDNALHLSDGSRAYQNDKGQLVDKDGKGLTGKDAKEAQSLLAQHVGPVTLQHDYQSAQKDIDTNTNWMTRVNKEDAHASEVGNNAAAHRYGTKTELGKNNGDLKTTAAATTAGLSGLQTNTKQASLAGAFDMESPPSSTSSNIDRHSFAGSVDAKAGIHANSPSTSFNAAAQGTGAAPVVASPTPRPTASPAP